MKTLKSYNHIYIQILGIWAQYFLFLIFLHYFPVCLYPTIINVIQRKNQFLQRPEKRELMEQLLRRETNILQFSIYFSSVGNNRPTKLDRSHENKCCPVCLTFLFSSKTILSCFLQKHFFSHFQFISRV